MVLLPGDNDGQWQRGGRVHVDPTSQGNEVSASGETEKKCKTSVGQVQRRWKYSGPLFFFDIVASILDGSSGSRG